MLQSIVSAKECGRHKWKEIASYVGVITGKQARTKYVNWQRHHTDGVVPGPCPICNQDLAVVGVTADLNFKSAKSVWDRAFQLQAEKEALEAYREHQQIIIPYYRLSSSSRRSKIDCNKLSYSVPVPDFDKSFLTFEFKVLRRTSDNCSGKDGIMTAYTAMTF